MTLALEIKMFFRRNKLRKAGLTKCDKMILYIVNFEDCGRLILK